MTGSFSLETLEELLTAAGKDEPTAAAMQTYQGCFRAVAAANPSPIERVVQWIQAQLVWDSRAEPLLQGMRSGFADGYRLRYTAGYADIELAIEQEGQLRHLVGEIYASFSQDDLFAEREPALIALEHHGQVVAETTTDLDGRFSFPNLPAADYAMTFFLNQQARIELVNVNVL
jgi:hypothetical protein